MSGPSLICDRCGTPLPPDLRCDSPTCLPPPTPGWADIAGPCAVCGCLTLQADANRHAAWHMGGNGG